MATLAPERALAELIPRAVSTVELDLRYKDVVAIAGRFDTEDPTVYFLSTHQFPGATQLVAAARAFPFQYMTFAHVRFDAATKMPTVMEIVEMTADSVRIRNAGIAIFKNTPEQVCVGGFSEPVDAGRAPDLYEGVRHLLHRVDA